jgi:hypothetical protein
MLVSRHQNAGKNWDVKIADRWLKNIWQFRHLGITVTDQNLIKEEIGTKIRRPVVVDQSV